MKIKKNYVYKRKKTFEKALFESIWLERDHNCQECGKYITDASVWNFHHIKTKAAYPELRLVKENIVILCETCHTKKHT